MDMIIALGAALETGVYRLRGTEEGPTPAAPPRTEGAAGCPDAPLPRSERGRRAHGGSGAAAQGVTFNPPVHLSI
ncbi:hypothetical protein HQS1_02020 [Delftia lacustris]|nr:hypothetical protein HQS1_02020 [Delftia lacustris]